MTTPRKLPLFLMLLLIGAIPPLLFQYQTQSSMGSVWLLGLFLGLFGICLCITLPALPAVACCVTALLAFGVSNSLARQFVNCDGSLSALDSRFVRSFQLLLILMIALCAVFFLLPYLLGHSTLLRLFREALCSPIFVLGVCNGVCLAIYLALILFGTAAKDGARVSLFGVTPLELVKVLVLFQLAVAVPGRRSPLYGPPMGCLLWGFHSLILLFCFKEMGTVLVLALVYMILLFWAHARRMAVAFAIALALALFAVFWVGIFLMKYREANPEGYQTLPGLLQSLQNAVASYMGRVDVVNAAAGGDNQIALARNAIARAGLFWGYTNLGYLPAGDTDMALAGSIECFGILTGVLIILIAILLCVRLWLAVPVGGKRTPLEGLQIAIAAMFSAQTLLMIGGPLGLIPLTGMTLPFVSRGTTSDLLFCGSILLFALCSALQALEHTPQMKGVVT